MPTLADDRHGGRSALVTERVICENEWRIASESWFLRKLPIRSRSIGRCATACLPAVNESVRS